MILVKLFLVFFKVGFIGFGGGLAILPLIYQGIRQFSPITPEEFANLVGIAQATPGPIAVNAATYVGYLTAGIPGSIVATMGVAVPAFIIVNLVVRFLNKYSENPLVEGAFRGIRPAAMGMIASALVFVGESSLFTDGKAVLTSLSGLVGSVEIWPSILAVLTVVLAAKFKMGPIKIMCLMAALGVGISVLA